VTHQASPNVLVESPERVFCPLLRHGVILARLDYEDCYSPENLPTLGTEAVHPKSVSEFGGLSMEKLAGRGFWSDYFDSSDLFERTR
jgi:hypothetical protein